MGRLERFGSDVGDVVQNLSYEWEDKLNISRENSIPQAATLAPVSAERLPPNNVITF
jgi:hypothetical protein